MLTADASCAILPILIPAPYGLRTFNLYLLRKSNSLTLIDAGVNTESCWNSFLSVLKDNGLAVTDIDQIIITHSHSDHIGLLNRIVSEKDIPIYAHHAAMKRLRRDELFLLHRIEFFAELYESMGCGEIGRKQVDRMKETVRTLADQQVTGNLIPLNDGDSIAGLKVIETLGHSPDHISLLQMEHRWLFAGDLMISHMSSNALIEPDYNGCRLPTLHQYLDSLAKCMLLNVDLVFTGHGDKSSNLTALATNRIRRIHRRANRILQLLTEGISVPSDLGAVCYQELYVNDFPMVMSEIVGVLDYLEQQQKIRKKRIRNVWHYHTINA